MKAYIFRQERRSFSSHALHTTSYVSRAEHDRALYENNPNYIPENKALNVFLKNSRGERKSDFSFSGDALEEGKRGAREKRKQLKEYIVKICNEQGVEPPNFSNAGITSRTILYKENLFTMSPEWQRDLILDIKEQLEILQAQNPENKEIQSLDYKKIGMEAVNFSLEEMQEAHDELFEYKDSYTVCSSIHWDEVNFDELLSDEPKHAAHIHQIQIPIITLPPDIDEEKFQELYRKTIEREEKQQELRRANDNARKRLGDTLKGDEHKSERKAEQERLKKEYSQKVEALEKEYGTDYITERDKKGNRTGRLLSKGRKVISCDPMRIMSSTKQEKIRVEYERTPDKKIDFDRPIEPSSYIPTDDAGNRFYLNFLQDRLYKAFQEKAQESPEIREDGTYIYRGRELSPIQAFAAYMAHSHYEGLERGERSLDPDGVYKRGREHIEASKYRTAAIIAAEKTKQEHARELTAKYEERAEKTKEETERIAESCQKARAYLSEIGPKIEQAQAQERYLDKQIQEKNEHLETLARLPGAVSSRFEQHENIYSFVESLNASERTKKELLKEIKTDKRGHVVSISGRLADALLQESNKNAENAASLARTEHLRNSISIYTNELESAKETINARTLTEFLENNLEVKEKLLILIEQERERARERERDKAPEFRPKLPGE